MARHGSLPAPGCLGGELPRASLHAATRLVAGAQRRTRSLRLEDGLRRITLCNRGRQEPVVRRCLRYACDGRRRGRRARVRVRRTVCGPIRPTQARAAVTPLEKVLLIGCARLWAATAMSGTRGACVVSSDQAPRRARSMGARGSGLFNGVTQNASLFAFQRAHQRHSLHFNVTLCISSGYRVHGLLDLGTTVATSRGI